MKIKQSLGRQSALVAIVVSIVLFQNSGTETLQNISQKVPQRNYRIGTVSNELLEVGA